MTVFTFARQSVRRWPGAILLWAGVVFTLVGGDGLRSERRYRDEARVARAEVTGKTMQAS